MTTLMEFFNRLKPRSPGRLRSIITVASYWAYTRLQGGQWNVDRYFLSSLQSRTRERLDRRR